MINDFNDLINIMEVPEDHKDDFIELLLTTENAFSQNFDYDLMKGNNGGNKDTFLLEYIKFKINLFLDNVARNNGVYNKRGDVIDPRLVDFFKHLATLDVEGLYRYLRINIGNENENIKNTKEWLECYKRILDPKNDDFTYCSSHQWYYFRSYLLDPNIEEELHSRNVKHRLYVSIDFKELMNFTEDFVKELTKRKIPYELKIKAPYTRKDLSFGYSENDVLVIYADTEDRVVEYVNILNELIKHNPEYKDAIHRPSPHLGIINGLIGYGREFGNKISYSECIADNGNKAVIKTLKDLNNEVISRGQLYKISACEILDIIRRRKNRQFVSTLEEDMYNLFKKDLFENLYKELSNSGYPTDFTMFMDKYSFVFGNPEETYFVKK